MEQIKDQGSKKATCSYNVPCCEADPKKNDVISGCKNKAILVIDEALGRALRHIFAGDSRTS